ncbi:MULTISPECIES: hypothetical protein [Bradyrhizobium]|uniref:hypothetical protein n=1 Tax=Bradyrhizobium elkanii TaxID=29448 RepID=UPI0027146F2A|nr:hypothetical protein [Bradyrhizobium elkanii]WLB85424.1 hypothetical protein QIH83_02185 [Bradyrhizobium elkanii]
MNNSTLATPWRAFNAYCARDRLAAFSPAYLGSGAGIHEAQVAAILAADIASQSRLVADDEEETPRRLASSRQVGILAVGPNERPAICEAAYSSDRAQMTSCSAMTIWPDRIAISFLT